MIARLALATLCLSGSALAADPPRGSWGRAGVSLDQYRTDAVECGRAGLSTDVSQMKAVKTLITASRQLDSVLTNQPSGGGAAPPPSSSGAGMLEIDPVALNTAQQVARITEGANPRARFREVRTALQTTTDQCLTGKGYVRFTLTRDQREHLEALRRGTPERHAYLHALASDPDVLARQRASVEVLPAQ
ncbi:hypothetical protein [Sphingomonas sp. Leaf25]|uniref:hypothetical protein n=1 Tax=Sphingomonas sp. Leaf25 TaxID=1735692 RepID=UPI0006FE619D|nr:hypothetical protein [Sphingomonas sp. Leaf25]KQM97629.1 hypothetical protein ASE78_09655 [Sphingomonas sp. Leaf25]